jgi:hypothetical protein
MNFTCNYEIEVIRSNCRLLISKYILDYLILDFIIPLKMIIPIKPMNNEI